jgi:hypothetical protein
VLKRQQFCRRGPDIAELLCWFAQAAEVPVSFAEDFAEMLGFAEAVEPAFVPSLPWPRRSSFC